MTGPINTQAIRAALVKATPAPWDAEGEIVGYGDFWIVSCLEGPDKKTEEAQANSELIVLLRNNIETLLDAHASVIRLLDTGAVEDQRLEAQIREAIQGEGKS